MRGRANKKKSDSMDLLLDTICNTFGGVLFIALLVVMLVQTSPAARDQNSQPAAPGETERLVRELEAVTDELARLKAARSGQLRTLASLAPAEVRQLLEDRRKREEVLESLNGVKAGLESLVSNVAEGLSTARAAAESAKVDLRQAESEVDRLEKELAAAKAAKVKELRTPVAMPPGGRQEIQFVVQYGRLYIWHQYDSRWNRRGLNTEDFLVIKSTSEGLETTPRPTRGTPIADSPQLRADLARMLRRFDSSRHYLAFAVRPDSYDDFEIARDVAIELGFEYRLYPLGSQASLRDRGGSGGLVQ